MTDKERFDFSVDVPPGGNIRIYSNNPKYLKGMDYAIIFSEMFTRIACDKELNGTDFRVFNGLLSHLSFGNEIDVSQSVLSKDLGIAQSHISSSIKKLLAKNYILISRIEGRQNVYQFNPHFGIKASPKDKKMLDHSWDERMKSK